MLSAATLPPPASSSAPRLSKQARYARRKADRGADVGRIPSVKNPRARAHAKVDPLFFAMRYFPDGLGQACLSVDHATMIDTMEMCFSRGGQYAQAIFRGFTKTTTAEVMTLWAMLHGHRAFIAWVGSEDEVAAESIDNIRRELEENDRLLEDYPEICHPIRALDGKHQRCESQTFRGRKTHSKIVTGKLVLPTIRLDRDEATRLGIPVDDRGYTLGGGARLESFGILSFKRGRKHRRGDGKIQRIDAAVIDDFQTDLSAGQPKDTERRLNVIRKSILRSGGHRTSLACVINGTIINAGDGMAQVLNRELFPQFRSRTIPMLKQRAGEEAEKLWFGEYARLLKGWENGDDDEAKARAQRAATAFYVEHRQAMDGQAVATWYNAFEADSHEISAVQHAYNILILAGEEVFASECQQNPKPPNESPDDLTLDRIIAKSLPAYTRGRVPLWASTLTAFCDVQDKALYWMVCAWGSGFTGHIVDYGIFPEQVSRSLALGNVKRTLRHAFPGRGPEAALRAGLDTLSEAILSKEFQREDGVRLTVSRMLIDSGDGGVSEQIYEQIRASTRKTQLYPSKGRPVLATQTQWTDFEQRAGEELSREYHYLLRPTKGSKTLRVLQIDTNWWKSFVTARLETAIGDPGCLSIAGEQRDNTQLAAQILAEYRVRRRTSTGKPVDEWRPRPGQSDNHLFDCLVGCAVAAAKEGIRLSELQSVAEERRVVKIPTHLRKPRHG